MATAGKKPLAELFSLHTDLPKRIGEGWENLLIRLGLTSVDLQHINHDNQGLQDKIKDGLIRWNTQKKQEPVSKRAADFLEALRAEDMVPLVEELEAEYDFDGSDGAAAGILDLSSFVTEEGWRRELKAEFTKVYFKGIESKLADDYAKKTQVFPPKDQIFHAFNTTPFDKVKVVILGRDPYFDDGQAMGMAFSVPNGVEPPPSLKNIYKELSNDNKIKNFTAPNHGNLEAWAERGVFLLNATLTVEAHIPNSHAKYGWQEFTDRVIEIISENKSGVVFILMGNFAHKKESLIDGTKHTVIKTAHPSPLSYKKFENCKCFSMADDALLAHKGYKMDWSL